MAGSVGTLKASLELDTSKFSSKLASAGAAANKLNASSAIMARQFTTTALAVGKFGNGLGAVAAMGGPAGIALAATAAGAILTTRAVKGLVNTFASIEKAAGLQNAARDIANVSTAVRRMGLEISKVQAGRVVGALTELRKLEGIITAVGRRFATELAAPVIVFGQEAVRSIDQVGQAMERLGMSWGTVGQSAIVIGAAFTATLTKITRQFLIMSQAVEVSIRNLEILKKAASGDFSGAMDSLRMNGKAVQELFGNIKDDLRNPGMGPDFYKAIGRGALASGKLLSTTEPAAKAFTGALPHAQGALRGTVDAAKLIQQTGRGHTSSETVQKEILAELKAIRKNSDPLRAEAGGALVLQPASF